jgi:hypothetical protein
MNPIQSHSFKSKDERGINASQKRAQPLRSYDQAEDSVWLSELQKVLSPYWAARSEYQP